MDALPSGVSLNGAGSTAMLSTPGEAASLYHALDGSRLTTGLLPARAYIRRGDRVLTMVLEHTP